MMFDERMMGWVWWDFVTMWTGFYTNTITCDSVNASVSQK